MIFLIIKIISCNNSVCFTKKGKWYWWQGNNRLCFPKKGKWKWNWQKKIYQEPKLETVVETEKQTAEREKRIIKSELEQGKVNIQVSREPDMKKVQDIFDEVKEEEPLNVEIFFIDDNDIFDSEEISN